MTYEINITVIGQFVTLLVLVYAVARGTITKGDCVKCKTGIDVDFDKGNVKFDIMTDTLSSHGTQLEAIDKNVTMLVQRHMKD